MHPIDRAKCIPRFEIWRVNNAVAIHTYQSNAGFLNVFERDSIEKALQRYNTRFKSQYRCAVYIDENWRRYWLEKVEHPEPGQPDFTITQRRPKNGYPQVFNWLRN